MISLKTSGVLGADDVRMVFWRTTAGPEVLLRANREGLRWLAEICEALADEDYDPRRPPHWHVDAALYDAEPGSLALEILLKPDPWPQASQ